MRQPRERQEEVSQLQMTQQSAGAKPAAARSSAARRAAFEESRSRGATRSLKQERLSPRAAPVRCEAARKALHSPVPASSHLGSPGFRRSACYRSSSAGTKASNSHFETFRIQPTGGSGRGFRRKDRGAECQTASQRLRSRRSGPSQKLFSGNHSEKEKRGRRS